MIVLSYGVSFFFFTILMLNLSESLIASHVALQKFGVRIKSNQASNKFCLRLKFCKRVVLHVLHYFTKLEPEVGTNTLIRVLICISIERALWTAPLETFICRSGFCCIPVEQACRNTATVTRKIFLRPPVLKLEKCHISWLLICFLTSNPTFGSPQGSL